MLLLERILSILSPYLVIFIQVIHKSIGKIIVKLKNILYQLSVMEIGLSIPIKMTAEEKEQYVITAKEVGISSIWIGDNPPINNAFLDIGRLFSSIKDMNFWTGITSPFYYSIEVLFSLSIWFSRNYSSRFGLGLGIGNMNIIDNEGISSKPFTSFKRELVRLQEIAGIRKEKQMKDDFPPLAIGGLGNKMINLAFEKADYLLLNSISDFDISRSLNILQDCLISAPKRTEIIPYGMIQILENKDEISPTLWNIAKDIAKGCSNSILKSHRYSAQMVEQIRKLPWNRQNKIPKGEILQIANDFSIFGTKEEVKEKMINVKKYSEDKSISNVVLGWIYSENQWDDLKEIVQFLK
jgi:hypothetical protein